MIVKKGIVIRFNLIGVHQHKNAEGDRAYLAHPHRHTFNFEVKTSVTHDDREIEFHDLMLSAQHAVTNHYINVNDIYQFGNASCETLATQLAERLTYKYKRGFTVSVFEDGEAGAVVEYDYFRDAKNDERDILRPETPYYAISKDFTFSAAHRLTKVPHDHQCSRPHGHNYIVRVTLASTELDSQNFVLDYGELALVKEWIDSTLDHRDLNEVLGFETTAENLARYIFDWTRGSVSDLIVSVGVSETSKTWAVFYA